MKFNFLSEVNLSFILFLNTEMKIYIKNIQVSFENVNLQKII